MDLRETPAQTALRQELRAYFAQLLPDDERRAVGEAGAGGDRFREVVKMLGRDGWLGVGWPEEYGGRGLGAEEQFIFYDEIQRAGVPFPLVTINTVGPTLMQFGTEAQKQKYLPGMLTGDIVFAIGYTEPNSGTDLASVSTRAVADGDDFVVDGTKIFTTGGNTADYVWMACRTDPEAAKHKGISILIVDTKDPGYSWTPIILSDGAHHTNASYYNDVHVPADMLVGEENGGWKLITTQLNHERVGLGPAGRIAGIYDQVHGWASKPGSDGVTPIEHDDVKRLLGQIKSIWRINELLNWQVAASGETIA
ncbi:MAG: acyl-CoA dehydrogenase family protein, partial [Actinomycetes bacterium]